MDINKEFEKYCEGCKNHFYCFVQDKIKKSRYKTCEAVWNACAELMSDELSKSNDRVKELEAVVSSQAKENKRVGR